MSVNLCIKVITQTIVTVLDDATDDARVMRQNARRRDSKADINGEFSQLICHVRGNWWGADEFILNQLPGPHQSTLGRPEG
uniref:Uncharacterized protein n=1 Tax=Bracon brevicornis TaxID=1563983 RepID=A0A6V7JHU3_9HYME